MKINYEFIFIFNKIFKYHLKKKVEKLEEKMLFRLLNIQLYS